MNNVTLMGFLGADPEIKYSDNGQPRAKASVATSSSWKDKNGEWQKKTHWHNLVMFGKTAESFTKFFSKGSRVLVEGTLEYYEYEDKKSGDKRKITQVNVRDFYFCEKKEENRGGAGTGGRYYDSAPNY